MLSKTPERKVISAAALLFAGWLLLIVSLFWDPVTAFLTSASHLWSPWRIVSPRFELNGTALAIDAYPIGNRLFWTVLLPCLPLYLMIFGHEAWRRICPLSFASQLPRRLKLQRLKPGKRPAADGLPYLLTSSGWLARNAWYVQFGLLLLGLSIRLVGANSSRPMLAALFLFVIVSAIITGALWGGKTWCNYLCPVNIVQRIYTEPRGLLESAPHVSKVSLPQSMCRTTVNGIEKTACVGCVSNCGDIDLEKAYWDTIGNPKRQNVYYMFVGLVVGFYQYYWVYSGDWDYYFSGIWTHEPGQAGRMLDPGVFFLPHAWWLPKLIAAPLTLMFASAASLAVGRFLQKVYLAARSSSRQTEPELINHCLAVASFMAINIFYIYGGRPNLRLLPETIMHVVDGLIILATSLWLWQAVHRSPSIYRRESIAASMLGQLKTMDVDVAAQLDGRALEDLRPDEIYVLSKVLPNIERHEKLTAYCRVMHNAIATGQTQSDEFLDTMNEFRLELGISDEEHLKAITPQGTVGSEVEVSILKPDERERCARDYHDLFGPVLADKVEAGIPLTTALALSEVRATQEVLRASFQIAEDEHEKILAKLTGAGGLFAQRLVSALEALRGLSAIRHLAQPMTASNGFTRAFHGLVVEATEAACAAKRDSISALLAAILSHVEEDTRRRETFIDRFLWSFERPDVDALSDLTSLQAIFGLKKGETEEADSSTIPGPQESDTHAVDHSDLLGGLKCVLVSSGGVAAALALSACAYDDPQLALRFAAALEDDLPDHWLLGEVISELRGKPTEASRRAADQVQLEITTADSRPYSAALIGSEASVGRAPGNTLTISDERIAPYHLLLRRIGDAIQVVRLTDCELYVDGVRCSFDSLMVEDDSSLALGSLAKNPPILRIHWKDDRLAANRQHWSTIAKMATLAELKRFQGLPLDKLADLARGSTVLRLRKGNIVANPIDDQEQTLCLLSGRLETIDDTSVESNTVASMAQRKGSFRLLAAPHGRMSGTSDGRLINKALKVVSPFAMVMLFTPEENPGVGDDLQGLQVTLSSRRVGHE
jgi:hypothetical protein